MKYFLLLAVYFIGLSGQVYGQQIKALKNAHAHNDYLHTRPLLDALAQGFISVEADIHLIDNQLYVSHDPPASLEKVPTLTDLYLEPLRQHISKNKGKVYSGFTDPMYLMIDIKTDDAATYQVLKEQLKKYKDILYTKGNPKGAVQIVLSGNRPIELVKNDPGALVSIDGRPADLDKNYDSQLMPVISQNYNQVISWKGEGTIPGQDFQTLRQLASTAHQQGKKVRLWATPEKENVWKTLLEAGIDFINTDELERLQEFLSDKNK